MASSYSSLPSKAGVYRFFDKKNTILYIGKANDLKARVSSYFVNKDLGEKTKVLVAQIWKIRITVVETELEALLLEAYYIKKYKPKYNILQKDSKSYVRIRITIKDKFPAVLLSRREDDTNSVYFGPYPSSGAVRLVLKTIRRAFPYQSVINHPKRICLYNHLGLCPCLPAGKTALPADFEKKDLEKEYRKNIRNIIRVLEGQTRKIMRELEKARDVLSRREKYEDAAAAQRQIDALSLITTPYHRPFEYEMNPNLRMDLRQKELAGLIEALRGTVSVSQLRRIECYDISNTQGINPTASMVVLTDGEIDKSQYRKFKMHARGPNDFAMMEEVITRRLAHTEWNYPDLFVVDGGKGQVGAALKSLKSKNLDIPLVGLAKREETIIIPTINSKFEIRNSKQIQNSNDQNGISSDLAFIEVSLPKDSPSLHLVMRIRDEAHRFAVTYHKNLRSKAAFRKKI